jgi:hypothetical protein
LPPISQFFTGFTFLQISSFPQREPMAALRVSTSVVVERGRFEPVERSSLHKALASVSHGQSMQAEEDHRSVQQNHSCYDEECGNCHHREHDAAEGNHSNVKQFCLKKRAPRGSREAR